MKICEFFDSGRCLIASSIAGIDALTNDDMCKYCINLSKPSCDKNNITVSLAISAVRGNKAKIAHIISEYGSLLKSYVSDNQQDIIKIRNSHSVGSQLWTLLEELGIEHIPGCKCLALAIKMNEWGPEGCRLHRKEIVSDMRENAKLYGWGSVTKAAVNAFKNGVAWRLNLADIYGSLVDEAIRRTEMQHATKS